MTFEPSKDMEIMSKRLNQLSLVSQTDTTSERTVPPIQDMRRYSLNFDPPIKTYIPRPPPRTEIPPRSNLLKYPPTKDDEYRASNELLRESLLYYEKARRVYEYNHYTRLAILAGNGIGNSNHTKPLASAERYEIFCRPDEKDQFLDFITHVLKQFNKLQEKVELGYDDNWMGMINELDLDEAFFVLNLGKIHQGGELYQILMTAGRALGECRLMELYRTASAEKLEQVRQTSFGIFHDPISKLNWQKLLIALNAERDLARLYNHTITSFREGLFKRRGKFDFHPIPGYSDRIITPHKPETPYFDEIAKAAFDSNISQQYFLTEIQAHAEVESIHRDFMVYCLEFQKYETLLGRFLEDISLLKTICPTLPDPTAYFQMKRRIEDFRGLFFVADLHSSLENGDIKYIRRPTVRDTATHLLGILKIEDEIEMTDRLNEFLEASRWDSDEDN
ncbi:hypothetical protein TWF694_000143 [Orbilia ellipsospora]|uniref:Uncharacterized protein n=1 Tax=Orbilia ellipsospora TaxID=2528407 RepID=A0AAV9XPH1_9PEZI